MADPEDTWIDRFIREVDAIKRQLRARPFLACIFLLGALAFGIYKLLPPTPAPDPMLGKVGWIYVGIQIDDHWTQSVADGIEPALTLALTGHPHPGSTYQVVHGVELREALPVQQTAGARPPMPASQGALKVGSTVKVDQVSSINITESEARTWIWAHVTVVGVP